MCTQADVTRIENKLDRLADKIDGLVERDSALDQRITRLEERWKAMAIVGTALIGIGSLVAPWIHSFIN